MVSLIKNIKINSDMEALSPLLDDVTAFCCRGSFFMKIDRRSLLTFIKQTYFHTNNAYTKALYKCECGNIKEINIRKVKELRTLSCGCLVHSGKNSRTHGYSKHPLYKIFKGILARCYNVNFPAYERYGGKGVKVCEEWLSDYSSFVKWGLANGWKKGLEVDKDIKAKQLGIKPILYSPEMCQFVTRRKNCNARSSNVEITYNGHTKNISEWATELNISPSRIRQRIEVLGWSVEDALSKKNHSIKEILFNGKSQSISAWGRELNISSGIIWNRLNKGWSIEKALSTKVKKQ